MKKKWKTKNHISHAFFLMLVLSCIMVSGTIVSVRANTSSDENEIYDDIEDLEGKTIAVVTGTTCDEVAYDTWDDINIMYVDSVSDLILAVKTGKAEALMCDSPFAEYIVSEDNTLACMDEFSLAAYDIGFAFQKSDEGQALCDEFNTYVAKWHEDGTIDEMMATWTDINSEKPEMDLDALTDGKVIVHFATDGTMPPFAYVENNEYAGLEVNIIYEFCKEAGYALEISNMNFGSLIASVTSGKQDVAAGCISITPERSESVLFSDSLFEDDAYLVILASHTASGAEENESQGFVETIVSSFKKTFVTEDRWLLFVQGIGQTLLITISSLILGTLLGFVLYMWSWTDRKTAKLVTGFFEWLMSRMPMVVLLMILFYIIFASSDLSGTIVSIIGFTLVFGGSVFGLIKMGVNAVDSGQMEAGLALGYTRIKAFFKIILPQAIRHFLPGYKSEVVSLIKSTAVVGYVAVQDLTKVSDLVRSRTYEAFFPLIATAIIYLVLSELLILGIALIDKTFFTLNRSKKQIMKGVKKDD